MYVDIRCIQRIYEDLRYPSLIDVIYLQGLDSKPGLARCFAALGSPIPKEKLYRLIASEHSEQDYTQEAFAAQLGRLEELNKLFISEEEVHLV